MARKKNKEIHPVDPDPSVSGRATFHPIRTRTVRSKRGDLKDFINMPVDILLEIFVRLTPQELLNLARTDKTFRSFLMSRTSAFVWKATRQNIDGLPECPSFLSEPQYANLVFFHHCHNCLKTNIRTVMWEFSTRYCRVCKNIMTSKVLNVNTISTFGRLGTYTFSRDIYHAVRSSRYSSLYHIPQVIEIQCAWERLGEDVEGSRHFIREQSSRVKEIQEHAQLCRQWMEKRNQSRMQELDDIRRERMEMIVSKLQQSGWEVEIDGIKKAFKFIRHEAVRVPKPLTDREWTKIEPALINMMQEERERALRAVLPHRLMAMSSAISAFSTAFVRTAESEMLPRFVELALMPEFEEIAYATTNIQVDAGSFDVLRDVLPSLTERWQNGVRDDLTRMLPAFVQPQYVDPLQLAVTFFECSVCQRLLRYPEVMAHLCLRRPWASWTGTDLTMYQRLVYDTAMTCAWSSDHLRVAASMRRMQTILNDCGMDANWTTRAEMDALDVWLCCHKVGRPTIKLLMPWRKAMHYAHLSVLNLRMNNIDSEPLAWRVASDHEKAKAKGYEATTHHTARMKYEQQPFWCCPYCVAFDGRNQPLQRARKHLDFDHYMRHWISPAESGADDPYLHPDGKAFPQPVIMSVERPSIGSLSPAEQNDLEMEVAAFFPSRRRLQTLQV